MEEKREGGIGMGSTVRRGKKGQGGGKGERGNRDGVNCGKRKNKEF